MAADGTELFAGSIMKAEMQPAAPTERRGSDWVSAQLEGKLFVPAEERTIDCTISNLSVGGAGVRCAELSPIGAFVVLYVDGFGRFDSVITHSADG